MPQSKREKLVHAISPEHPSGHGKTNKLDNDAFVAGIKLKQAKEKLQSSAKAGKPHETLSRLAGKVSIAQDKHDKLVKKKAERDSK